MAITNDHPSPKFVPGFIQTGIDTYTGEHWVTCAICGKHVVLRRAAVFKNTTVHLEIHFCGIPCKKKYLETIRQ